MPSTRTLSKLIISCLVPFLVNSDKTNNAQGLSLTLTQTSTPPLLDVPTYSLATQGTGGDGDGTTKTFTSSTAMNILTYATPVSIRPDRIWSIGLYKGTTTHKNFSIQKEGVLQLLKPKHAPLVKLLGGSSSREVDKAEGCRVLGHPWIVSMGKSIHTGDDDDDDDDNDGDRSREEPITITSCDLLPDCACYLKLTLVGDLIDCGSHEVALCKVESMSVPTDGDCDGYSNDVGPEPDSEYLSTGLLREMNIITKQGRVAE